MKVSFNSTLVQLKGSPLIAKTMAYTCFNSTLVQLKDIRQITIFQREPCFNSTLVQLKAGQIPGDK